MGLESKFWNKLGFILILAHFPATWELKIWKFSNFGQNHFSDFETPFLAGLMMYAIFQKKMHGSIICMYTLTKQKNDYMMQYCIISK